MPGLGASQPPLPAGEDRLLWQKAGFGDIALALGHRPQHWRGRLPSLVLPRDHDHGAGTHVLGQHQRARLAAPLSRLPRRAVPGA